MRKNMVVLGLAALFVLGAVSMTLGAEEKMAEAKTASHHPAEAHKIMGEVVSVDANAHTLVVKEMLKKGGETKEMTFNWTDKTKVMMSYKTAAMFTDLKAGDSVTVHYHGKAGKMDATEVVVAKAMKK